MFNLEHNLTSHTAAIKDIVQTSHVPTFFSSYAVLHDSLLQIVSIQLYFSSKLSINGHQIFILWLFFLQSWKCKRKSLLMSA